jgi:mono/diheme cytochrome c family protein
MLSMLRTRLLWVAAALGGAAAFAQVVPLPNPSRGELLYATHCIACHTSQMHWRDARLASDWASLRALVRRWQEEARLAWSESDIDEVTRHLNQRHYRFALPGEERG